MGDIRLVVLTNQDPGFYPLLGPFLSQRNIVAELGFPVFDDPGKVWFVAMDGDKVAGFAGLVSKGDVAIFCSDYVLPDYRQHHIHDQLIEARLLNVSGKASAAMVMVCNTAKENYERHGFNPMVGRMLKRYTKMGKEL